MQSSFLCIINCISYNNLAHFVIQVLFFLKFKIPLIYDKLSIANSANFSLLIGVFKFPLFVSALSAYWHTTKIAILYFLCKLSFTSIAFFSSYFEVVFQLSLKVKNMCPFELKTYPVWVNLTYQDKIQALTVLHQILEKLIALHLFQSIS